MAYGALISLQHVLDIYILQDQYKIFCVDEEQKQPFKALLNNITVLQKILENFPRKAQKLETEISEAAHEAESAIEFYISDTLSHGKVSDAENANKLFLNMNKVGGRIEIIVQAMVMEMGSKTCTVGDDSLFIKSPSDIGFELPANGTLIGLDDDLKKIKDDIFSNSRELVTIPIVGMGGIGKTTLARAVFDDPVVVARFDLRRWLTISQSYDVRETLLSLLGDKTSYEAMDLVGLTVEVHKLLKKRRYLITVDDIWSLDVWDGIKRLLPDDLNGSRILLTTRDYDVANYVISSSAICSLKLMDEERSWSLFEQMVFGEEGCPLELVSSGRKIAEGCRGLPLAIVVITGILSNIRHTPDSWKGIAEDVNGALCTCDESFMEILSLSYYHLPAHLKPCFLYFGAFPEDYEIQVTDLVRLWVSEGFLKASTSKTEKDVEEIAYEYLEDLVKRNLVMINRRRFSGKIRECKIHDLVRDICIRRAREEKFLHHAKDIVMEGIINAHRAIFTSEISSHNMTTFMSLIHTALCFQHVDNLVSNLHFLRLVRVLDARTIMLDAFPLQLLQLYHLRYLALSYNGNVLEIPTGVNKLENLETLIIWRKRYDISSMVVVPSEILMMRKLRHIQVQRYFVLRNPINLSFHLENLRTILTVCNIRFEQQVVESIASVRKLAVTYNLKFDENETWSDFYLQNLQYLSYIGTLSIYLEFWYDMEWCKKNPFLESIVFPCSLKKLEIFGCAAHIPWDDMSSSIGSLPNLEELVLSCYVCSGDVWETKEGDFQNLRVLEIRGSDLKYWRTESYTHFPRLEYLILSLCSMLIELPDCIGDIPTLQIIGLDTNCETVSDWASRIVEEQHEMGNDQLRIVRRIHAFQGVLGEIIEPNRQLSVDQLAERLILWAGDDEIKHRQAVDIGVAYILSHIDATKVPSTQIEAFLKALRFFSVGKIKTVT